MNEINQYANYLNKISKSLKHTSQNEFEHEEIIKAKIKLLESLNESTITLIQLIKSEQNAKIKVLA